MKKYYIAAVIGAILFTVSLFIWGCKIFKHCDPCDPKNIKSGKSSQHHDQKKFKAMIRVMWIHRDGPVYHVRYANMKTIEPRVYFQSLPSKIIVEGDWIPVDSLYAWDTLKAN